MLSISKNKSKNSAAVVKITKKKPPQVRQVPQPQTVQQLPQIPQIPQTQQLQQLQGNRNPVGVQKQLTEVTFRQYLDGFVGILPKDLPRTTGGRIRYAIDTVGANGQVISSQYRLGGFVKSVTPDLSVITLFNPFAKKTWTVKVNQPSGKRLRLYYMGRGTSDETATIRALISKLENNQLRISKV